MKGMGISLHKGFGNPAQMRIFIDQGRADLALRFIHSVLVEFGPTHNPRLRGIHHKVTDLRQQGEIRVDFPDWETEWEGSWDDLRMMVCAIADHLNLEAETDK